MVTLKDNKGVVGKYTNGDTLVVTQWMGREYETLVRHHNINYGRMMFVAKYGNDENAAKEGHEKWVHRVGGVLSDTKVNEGQDSLWVRTMKISYHAFLKVIHRYGSKEHPISISIADKDPTQITVKIKGGKYSGSCIYDMAKMEAWGLTPRWSSILREAKAETIDKQEQRKKTPELPFACALIEGYDI